MSQSELERRLRKVQHLFPECQINTDSHCEVIIHTGEHKLIYTEGDDEHKDGGT